MSASSSEEPLIEVGFGPLDGPEFFQKFSPSGESSETYPMTGAILEGAFTAPMNFFRNELDDSLTTRFPSAMRFMLQVCAGHGYDDRRSCDFICGDRRIMFGSPDVMWDRMTLTSIWQGFKTYDNDGGQSIMRQLERELSVVKRFNLSTFDGLLVLSQIHQCVEKSCRIDGDDCGYSFDLPRAIVNGDFSNPTPFLDSSFRNGVRAVANIDIAGPGMSGLTLCCPMCPDTVCCWHPVAYSISINNVNA